MRSLVESLFDLGTTQTMESLFDKNLTTKEIEIKGVSVDDSIWGKCVKEYEDVYKQIKGSPDRQIKKHLPRFKDNRVLYLDKDCLVCVYEGNGSSDVWLYVLSPETIYMNYLTMKQNGAIPKTDSIYEYDVELTDFAFCLKWNMWSENEWYPLQGCSRIPSRSEGIGKNQICRGYIPETISDKAKKIIEDYKYQY